MAFFGGGGASASNMVGATSSSAGTAGLVPQPAAGREGSCLMGDASFDFATFPSGKSYGSNFCGFQSMGETFQSFQSLNVNGGLLLRGGLFYPAGTYNRIACYVGTGSAGKNMKLGIYDTTENGQPSSLIASGTVSLASTGVAEATVSSFTLKSKFYFCAWIIDNSGASVWYGTNQHTYPHPWSTWSGTSANPDFGSNNFHCGGYYSVSYASGLPSTLGSTGYTSYNPSLVFVRNV
jgi:hypothetical protein